MLNDSPAASAPPRYDAAANDVGRAPAPHTSVASSVASSGTSLISGRPRFGSAVSALAPEQAWRQLLQTHGPAQAANQVHGDFAVALRLPDGAVFMAVDRFAAQTLCYRIDGSQLRFAANATDLAGKALGEKPELDTQAIFDYLYFHVIPSPRTIHSQVRRLEPGHCAVFRDGQLTVTRYWVPTFSSPAKNNFAELKDEFRQLLLQATKRELDGTRVACFLSGGTDSSTVTGMLAQAGGPPPATYSIGFEAEGYDEMVYARLAARHFGAEHHEYYVTPNDLVQHIPAVAAYCDQPFGNSSALPAYSCAMQARGDGVTRILAGDGGDELFGGNSRYATQEIFSWYQQVPSALRKGLMEPFFGLDLVSRTPGLKKGSGYIRQANTRLPERLQAFNLVRRLGYSSVLSPGFMAQVDIAGVSTLQQAVWDSARSAHEIDINLAYDWRYTLAESDLPKVRSTTSMAGLSVGFPMLDDDLLAFSMRLPPHYKLNRLRLRWFFKEALRGFLPDDILTKKKQGFGLPFGVWMMRHEGLRQLATDSVRSFATRGVVRPEFVQELLEKRLPEHPHYYGTMVWILMMMEQWMRHHAPDYRCEQK
jgi:asparagine synthase (glutamine-hydrolysing)